MTVRDDLLRQAREARAAAARAQRLALGWSLSNPRDTAQLLAYAEELSERARSLEARARASDLSVPPIAPAVTHVQEQVQQQAASTPSDPAGESTAESSKPN